MLTIGINFFAGKQAVPCNPTAVENATYVSLSEGIYDDLLITRNIDMPTNVVPDYFDYDTILWAPFNGNTIAGNIQFSTDTVSHILLKRRMVGELKWMTIRVFDVNDINDLDIRGVDYYCPYGDVQYAIVPSYYGIEGNYNIVTTKSTFEGFYIAEKDQIWGTIITENFCDTTRNIEVGIQNLLNHKYPISVSNSIANYDSGSCSGEFYKYFDDGCTFDIGEAYDTHNSKYRKEFMDYLTNKHPKILKVCDGRVWLITVSDSPTDSAVDIYNLRQIAFNWTETGNYLSERDMYYANLSDVNNAWWSS